MALNSITVNLHVLRFSIIYIYVRSDVLLFPKNITLWSFLTCYASENSFSLVAICNTYNY